jgi:DNA-binding MarR family transcriptional regulator
MKEVERMAESISQVQRKMRAKLSNELSQGEITIPQYHILDYLHDRGEATMHEVADYLFVTPPAVTGLVANLVKMNLVQRKFSPSDRRIIIVCLTTRGKTVISKIKNQFNVLFITIFKKISPAERKSFLEVTEKMEKLL